MLASALVVACGGGAPATPTATGSPSPAAQGSATASVTPTAAGQPTATLTNGELPPWEWDGTEPVDDTEPVDATGGVPEGEELPGVEMDSTAGGEPEHDEYDPAPADT